MPIEGELVVRLAVADGRVTSAQARAERPRVAGRLFDGRPANEAPSLAGALFAICGRAQAIAAAAAVEAAQGIEAPAAERAARETRLAAEEAQEHLTRLLVDWPALAGLEPSVAALVRARAHLAPLLKAAAGTPRLAEADLVNEWAQAEVFGVAPADFLSLDSIGGFANWVRGAGTAPAAFALAAIEQGSDLGTCETAFLGPADAARIEAIARALETDPAFDDSPTVEGVPCETGSLARQSAHPLLADALATFGHGVIARVVARLLETAMALDDLATGAGARHGSLKRGDAGLGWAETARGLLVHRARVEAGKLAGYRIVAPTEWNFHPDGAFARGAAGLADDGSLEARARWIVGSLDPCVGVRYEVARA